MPRDFAAIAVERWIRCNAISVYANANGLAATPVTVNRRYDVWVRWYEGRYATGYLMRATGVRRKDEKGSKGNGTSVDV